MAQAAEYLGASPMSVRRLLAAGVIQGKHIVVYAPWILLLYAVKIHGCYRRGLAAIINYAVKLQTVAALSIENSRR
jgi:hypothetical protein